MLLAGSTSRVLFEVRDALRGTTLVPYEDPTWVNIIYGKKICAKDGHSPHRRQEEAAATTLPRKNQGGHSVECVPHNNDWPGNL